MDSIRSFRILSDGAFEALPTLDKIRYLRSAIGAHKSLERQIANALKSLPDHLALEALVRKEEHDPAEHGAAPLAARSA